MVATAVGIFDNLNQLIEGSGALLAALASVMGGFAALGSTKRDTKKSADGDCQQRVDDMLATFQKGVNLGQQIPG